MTFLETEKPLHLYSPEGIEAASEEWNCNCGPAALSAITNRSLNFIKSVVGVCGFFDRPYMNPTHQKQALDLLKIPYITEMRWPRRGLVFIQWGGPWLRPGVPFGAAYRNTHWIAVDGAWVYDINAYDTRHGGWIMRSMWDHPDHGLAAWIMQNIKRCDGTWSVKTSLSIEGEAVRLVDSSPTSNQNL